MADAYGIDNVLLLVVIVVIVLTIVTFLELRYFRSFMKKRRDRVDLPDNAHNGILTGKAIANALRSVGVDTTQADDVIAEAETAYRRRDYRVAIQLSEQAKTLLKSQKAKHDKVGDLGRLQRVRTAASDEPTTKEVLQKEHPPNYTQAKFTLSLAQERIAAARTAGRGTAPAEGLLKNAQASFDAADYGGRRDPCRERDEDARPLAGRNPAPREPRVRELRGRAPRRGPVLPEVRGEGRAAGRVRGVRRLAEAGRHVLPEVRRADSLRTGHRTFMWSAGNPMGPWRPRGTWSRP